jgi:hypothetical protein
MSRWVELHDKAQTGNAKRAGTFNKGLRRFRQELKRQEAEFRAENVKHDRTRAHRQSRCACQ